MLAGRFCCIITSSIHKSIWAYWMKVFCFMFSFVVRFLSEWDMTLLSWECCQFLGISHAQFLLLFTHFHTLRQFGEERIVQTHTVCCHSRHDADVPFSFALNIFFVGFSEIDLDHLQNLQMTNGSNHFEAHAFLPILLKNFPIIISLWLV